MTTSEFNDSFCKNIDQLEHIISRKTKRMVGLKDCKMKEAIRIEINVMSKVLRHFHFLFDFCQAEIDGLTNSKNDMQKQLRVARHYLKSLGVDPVTLSYLKESDFIG